MTTILQKPLAFGADHRGYELKEKLVADFDKQMILDCGTHNSESTDASDYAVQVAEKIATGEAQFGVLICGSGHMMCMAANRFPFIRSVLCYTSEEARSAREHHNANVLCLSADTLNTDDAQKIIDTFLNTAPSMEERFVRRRQKLTNLDPATFTVKDAE